MEYLLDTDWAIDYLHKADRTVRRLEELLAAGIGISIVSLAELYDGLVGSKTPDGDAEALRLLLQVVDVIQLDDAACRIFGRERYRLRATGNIIGDMDILIGATAISKGLTLLTHNRKDFERIQGLKLI